MKQIKLIYWISTGLIALMMLNSSYMCFASPDMKASLAHLGFPDFFRIELGITKFLGVLAIIFPFVPSRIKEWAYAGFFIMFISGIIAHLIIGDPASTWGVGITALLLLIVSYVSYRKLFVPSLRSAM